MVAQIAAPTAQERTIAADMITDVLWSAMDPQYAAVLSRALEVMLLLEDSECTIEAQLNALIHISAHSLTPADVIARVIGSRLWDHPWPWLDEYMECLREDLEIALR